MKRNAARRARNRVPPLCERCECVWASIRDKPTTHASPPCVITAHRAVASMRRTKSSGSCKGAGERGSHNPVAIGVGRSAHSAVVVGRGLFRTFPEPEAEGVWPRAESRRRLTPSDHVVFERGPTEQNAQPSIRDRSLRPKPRSERPMKNEYDGRRHSHCRASSMGTRSATASGSSAKSFRPRP